MDSFAIGPVTAKPLWFLAAVMAILVAVLVMMAWLTWSTRNSRVEVEAQSIRLVGDLWGRRIPVEKLRLDEVRHLDLHRDREFGLHRRTMGSGLPGFSSGWFKLRNGEKALVYVTDGRNVICIPTTEGYSLLLSVTEPDRFMARLRQAAG